MENGIWQEKEEFGFSFPFRCWDSMLPDFTYPAHWHEYYEIILVLEGQITITLDGTTDDFFRGDIVSVDPGQVHSFPRSASGTRLRFYHFEGNIFSKDDNLHGLAGERLFYRKPFLCAGPETPDGVLYTQVYGVLDKLFNEYKEKKRGFRLAVKAGLYLLVLAYLRENSGEDRVQFPEKPASLMIDRRLERVFLLIYKKFNRLNLDLDSAAREAAMSRFHFARVFKRQTGRSFHAYLTMVRLSHAKELLLKSDLSMRAVASQSGFASLPTFHRIFKADTGCSPASFRKNETSNNRYNLSNN
jgi:AraC-like DNA-binding protein